MQQPVQALSDGDVLGKRFRILGTPRQGGTATLVRAVDLASSAQVAVKTVPTLDGAHPRFLAEIQALEQVRHPHIVPVLGSGKEPWFSWYAMPWYDRGSLWLQVHRYGPPEPMQAIRWMLDVLTGLDAVHRAGIVHRDLKPANLLLRNDGSVDIADFGLAKLPAGQVAYRTQTGSGMGTEGYASPEGEFDASKVDARADLYGVAVCLWEVLRVETPDRFTFVNLDPTLLERIPEPLQEIILKDGALYTGSRHASAWEMARALCAAAEVLEPGMGRGTETWLSFRQRAAPIRWIDRLRAALTHLRPVA